MPFNRRLLGGLAICLVMSIGAGIREANAQEGIRELDASYLVDGGAIPFFWIPLAGSLAINQWVGPRDTPLGFSKSEGGAPSQRSNELPGWATTAAAGLAAATIFVDGDESRWYHLKGFGQAVITTSFLTASAKRLFGRHRPDHDGTGSDSGDGNKSFPSGHASQTAAAVTYFALYLHQHGFDRWREQGDTTWWEVASYATLGAIAVAVPAERVLHKRHHLSDVVAGSVLGAAVSTGLFLWQEHRYENRGERIPATMSDDVARIELPAPTMGDTAPPTVTFSGTF